MTATIGCVKKIHTISHIIKEKRRKLMSEKAYRISLAIVLAVCILATAFTVGYTVYRHQNCSIIGYIANER